MLSKGFHLHTFRMAATLFLPLICPNHRFRCDFMKFTIFSSIIFLILEFIRRLHSYSWLFLSLFLFVFFVFFYVCFVCFVCSVGYSCLSCLFCFFSPFSSNSKVAFGEPSGFRILKQHRLHNLRLLIDLY